MIDFGTVCDSDSLRPFLEEGITGAKGCPESTDCRFWLAQNREPNID